MLILKTLIIFTIIFGHHVITSFSCPIECTCDQTTKTVTCIGKEKPLNSIPKDIPRDTEELYLNNNNIQQISRADLAGLNNLRKLYLHKNHIAHIDEYAFTDLHNLIELNLSKNYLSYITQYTFVGLWRLKSLWLSEIHSHIVPCIDDFVFTQTPSLEDLFLTKNYFHFISNNLFSGLSKLKYLTISLNQINKINSLAFSHFSKDVDVHLGRSYLCCCSTAAAIESLMIKPSVKCTIKDCYNAEGICNRPYDTTCLRKLTPPTTSIPDNPESDISKPTDAVVQTTPITTTPSEPEPVRPATPRKSSICPEECKCYNDFKDVLCHQNFLSAVPGNIPNETEKLILNDNLITRIRKYDFYDLPYLKELYLHNNNIERLDDGCFEELGNLTSLFLLNNHIDHISPHTFQGLENLNHLSLSNLNTKRTLINIEHGSFQMLGELESLQLNGNRFRCLSQQTLIGLGSLETLTVSLHLIEVLRSDVFDGLPADVTIQTDMYDMAICCCTTALAIHKTKSLAKYNTQCNLETCSNDKDPVCKMSFSSTTEVITSDKSTAINLESTFESTIRTTERSTIDYLQRSLFKSKDTKEEEEKDNEEKEEEEDADADVAGSDKKEPISSDDSSPIQPSSPLITPQTIDSTTNLNDYIQRSVRFLSSQSSYFQSSPSLSSMFYDDLHTQTPSRSTTKVSTNQYLNSTINSTSLKNFNASDNLNPTINSTSLNISFNTSENTTSSHSINTSSTINSSWSQQGNDTRSNIPKLQAAPIEASVWGKDDKDSSGQSLRTHFGVLVFAILAVLAIC